MTPSTSQTKHNSSYDRHGTYSIEEVFALVPNFNATKKAKRTMFQNKSVKINSHRLYCFQQSGTTCTGCGLEAEYFAMEKHSTTEHENYHFNLYGKNEENEEVLFTKDHNLAKSRGGRDHPSNYQTMCYPCNQEKGDYQSIAFFYGPGGKMEVDIDGEVFYSGSEFNFYTDRKKIEKLLRALGHPVGTKEDWDGELRSPENKTIINRFPLAEKLFYICINTIKIIKCSIYKR